MAWHRDKGLPLTKPWSSLLYTEIGDKMTSQGPDEAGDSDDDGDSGDDGGRGDDDRDDGGDDKGDDDDDDNGDE